MPLILNFLISDWPARHQSKISRSIRQISGKQSQRWMWRELQATATHHYGWGMMGITIFVSLNFIYYSFRNWKIMYWFTYLSAGRTVTSAICCICATFPFLLTKSQVKQNFKITSQEMLFQFILSFEGRILQLNLYHAFMLTNSDCYIKVITCPLCF